MIAQNLDEDNNIKSLGNLQGTASEMYKLATPFMYSRLRSEHPHGLVSLFHSHTDVPDEDSRSTLWPSLKEDHFASGGQ
jgi:hypothetical protein